MLEIPIEEGVRRPEKLCPASFSKRLEGEWVIFFADLVLNGNRAY